MDIILSGQLEIIFDEGTSFAFDHFNKDVKCDYRYIKL